MTYLAMHLILRCLHLSYEFLPLYFIIMFIFSLFHFGGASFTIFILSKLDLSTVLCFSTALELPTFLIFLASAAFCFFFSSSAAASAASLSFFFFSTYFQSASSFFLFFLSCATFFATRYFSWTASTSTSESEESDLL